MTNRVYFYLWCSIRTVSSSNFRSGSSRSRRRKIERIFPVFLRSQCLPHKESWKSSRRGEMWKSKKYYKGLHGRLFARWIIYDLEGIWRRHFRCEQLLTSACQEKFCPERGKINLIWWLPCGKVKCLISANIAKSFAWGNRLFTSALFIVQKRVGKVSNLLRNVSGSELDAPRRKLLARETLLKSAFVLHRCTVWHTVKLGNISVKFHIFS